MFYSQFILAKKGPLGTIWIAAHLERKLRKNQVADTDIGVSVDSILCPDVPIALRLSSHLLLGVVRIYSRKVSYLFDDCSEALLKVKQAFRSAAVDLPPEESKAPYHSITLPETFDLDDFELPDNDMFQGNYVDHHTSTREQITLQDNMEGVVFSTSQFGLDERFGDGDASGLNLDEELFLHKVDSTGHAGVSDDHQSTAQAVRLKQDEFYEGPPANPDSRGDLMDYAQAPSTPGLTEVPNVSNVQEMSACEDHMEDEDNPLVESVVNENSITISRKLNHQENTQLVSVSLHDDRNSLTAVAMSFEGKNNILHDLGPVKRQSPSEVGIQDMSSNDQASASGTSVLVADEAQVSGQELNLTEKAMLKSLCPDSTQQSENDIPSSNGSNVPSVSCEENPECIGLASKESARGAPCSISFQQVMEGAIDDNLTSSQGEKSKDIEVSENSSRPISSNDTLELSSEHQLMSSQEKPVDPNVPTMVVCDVVPCAQVNILRPCDAGLELPDSSHPGGEVPNDLDKAKIVSVLPLLSAEGGELMHSAEPSVVQDDKLEQNSREGLSTEPVLLEDIHVTSGKSDYHASIVAGDSMLENVSSSAVFPAPEKLLSVPDEHNDQPRDLLLVATSGDLACVDESDAGSRIISGKKRSYTESTLTEQSLNSVESSRVVRAKRTVDAIPDDLDLLSSILVGRRSSVLKVKPSPPYEITSVKRHQTPRTNAAKRKVLMDDSMVLHGDTIRQQLTNTEDIRRLRKKAPCTRPEISMILKQFLEDDIFGEPICSGVSVELASLFNQAYDVSRIIVSKDANILPVLPSTEIESCSVNKGIEDVVDSGIVPPVAVETDVGNCGEFMVVRENCDLHPDAAVMVSENRLDETCEVRAENMTDPEIKPIEHKEEAEETNSSLPTLPQNLAEDENGVSYGLVEAVGGAQVTSPDKGGPVDAIMDMEVPVVSSDDIRELEHVMLDASLVKGSENNIDSERIMKSDDTVTASGSKPTERDEVLFKAEQYGSAVDFERDSVEQTHDACGPSGEIENDISRVHYEEPMCNGISGGATSIMNSFYPSDFGNTQSSFLDGGEFIIQDEGYPSNVGGAEISGLDMQEYHDFNYSAAANDTEFLNVDDDEVAEVTDDYTPTAEEMRFVENSGWSSRTRAVANYLQTLFMKESEYGRKALSMDSLLVGKTRKEASRMFFEALVLKTKDFIHVEQECPFHNITLKPRTKLLKDF